MICIRCRQESKGPKCLYCNPAAAQQQEAPTRATGKRAVPPPPAKPAASATIIIAFVLVAAIAIVVVGYKVIQAKSEPDKTVVSTSTPKATPSADDPQKKLGPMLREMFALQERIESGPADPALEKQAKDLGNKIEAIALAACGNDKSKVEPYILECMARHVPDFGKKVAGAMAQAKEALAATTLRSIWQANSIFYTADSDGNGVNDYWVLDASGFLRLVNPKTGKPVALISDPAIGLADASPAIGLATDGRRAMTSGGSIEFIKLGAPAPAPSNGYLFRAVPAWRNDKGAAVPFDTGNGRNPDRFALCAYPFKYGDPCRMTFLVTETGAIHTKDTGGKPVLEVPQDLDKDGWK